jgi:hypothetical protein
VKQRRCFTGTTAQGVVVSNEIFIAILMALVVVAYAALAIAAYIRMRGTRIVTCPESKQPAAVTVNAAHSALSGLLDPADIQISTCSRWPARPECDQACAREIASAPNRTTTFQMMAQWYAGKQCGICGRDMPPLSHFAPEPGLMSVTSQPPVTVAWTDVPPEQIPKMLPTHLPVCSSCHLMTWFQHEHPELVIDRHRTQQTDTRVH